MSERRSIGLHDKHGREIHEGDIVRTTHGLIEEVVWLERKQRFIGRVIHMPPDELSCRASHRWEDAEIIGDRGTTPELLEQSNVRTVDDIRRLLNQA